jgi:hypothetical protein
MAHNESSIESRAGHLIEAIENVGDGIWKIEVWVSALLRFVSPVPVYEPGDWSRCLAATRAPASTEKERRAA